MVPMHNARKESIGQGNAPRGIWRREVAMAQNVIVAKALEKESDGLRFVGGKQARIGLLVIMNCGKMERLAGLVIQAWIEEERIVD